MRTKTSGLWIALVLAPVACGEEDTGDDGAAATTAPMTTAPMTTAPAEDSGDEDTGDESSGGPATTAPMTTTPAEDTGTDPSTTTDPATEDSGPGDTTTGAVGSPCDPDPADDDCDACTKTNCCTQLETCFADPICECMTNCVMGPADFGPCGEQCGQTGNFMPVTDCAASSCLFECIG